MQIKGSEVKIFKLRCILIPEDCFYLSKRVDPSEMPNFVAFYLESLLFANVPINKFPVCKGTTPYTR